MDNLLLINPSGGFLLIDPAQDMLIVSQTSVAFRTFVCWGGPALFGQSWNGTMSLASWGNPAQFGVGWM